MTDASAFNEAIRAAAGRRVDVRRVEPEPRVGDIGIGRGGGAALPSRRDRGGDMNERLRKSVRLARGFLVPGGVHLDAVDVELDDVFGRR